MRRLSFLLGALSGVLVFASPALALLANEPESIDLNLTKTVPPWATPPSNNHRLYLDVYNITDYWDFETLGIPHVNDRTILADTIRPTATILWDERFRIQIGAIAEKSYGAQPEIIAIDPWLQLLWQPLRPLHVVLGDLSTPHYYLPALFYETNYVEVRSPPDTVPAAVRQNDVNQPSTRNHETGLQLIVKKPRWYDDFFFNYYGIDTPTHNEQFDWGIVHENEVWKYFRFNYQFHWRHEGGESNPHPISVINDVTQAIGGGAFYDFDSPFRAGGDIYYLHSHYRIDAPDTTKNFTQNGNAQMYDAYVRYKRFKAIYTYWRGIDFFTKDGNPIYSLPRLITLSLRWDIIKSADFNLVAEMSNYFVGNNNQQVDRRTKPVFRIQAAWQFSIPVFEWTSPAASPEGAPIPTRWDYGI